MKIRVHVNSHVVRANAKHGTNEPPIAIRDGSVVTYAHQVQLTGDVVVVYRAKKPLKCGAKVWIEADGAIPVEVVS